MVALMDMWMAVEKVPMMAVSMDAMMAGCSAVRWVVNLADLLVAMLVGWMEVHWVGRKAALMDVKRVAQMEALKAENWVGCSAASWVDSTGELRVAQMDAWKVE